MEFMYRTLTNKTLTQHIPESSESNSRTDFALIISAFDVLQNEHIEKCYFLLKVDVDQKYVYFKFGALINRSARPLYTSNRYEIFSTCLVVCISNGVQYTDMCINMWHNVVRAQLN